MPSKLYTLCLLSFILILNSCIAPREVVRIAPEQSENVFWHQGQAIAEAQQENIIARAAYSHANRNFVVFDVEIFNESNRPCLISPEDFSITTQQNLRIKAADPEKEIFALEMDASRKEARTKNWAIAGGVTLAAAAVVAAVATDGDDVVTDNLLGNNYNIVDATFDIADGVAMVAWGMTFQNDRILSVDPEVLPEVGSFAFWQDVALRRTTIMPKSNIRGLIAFPRETTTPGSLTLDLPLECTRFSFRFTQKNFRP
ncbi:MAG: hypothetical protein AAF705_16005 [Bacteroidota bacterium]